MQKLRQRTKKNTPTDTPQVRSNCDQLLNRDQSLSVTDLKTCFNNPEVDLRQQHSGELKAKVYVLNNDSTPLMPCSPCKARKLLKSKKAAVIKLYPFTIKLTYESEFHVQVIKLGIDSGYKNIGFSAITENEELFGGELIIDDKTSERLNDKSMYRRLRRRKLWYRKQRFLNRKRMFGFLNPSIQRRYNTHIKLIDKIKKLLPISEIIIEVSNFNIAKIENPDIKGIEYQEGNMYGYQSIRSYLMAREEGNCQLCGKDIKNKSSHIHHIVPRSRGGTNRPKNLAILHEDCHEKLHKQNLFYLLKKSKQYKSEIFMSIINKRVQQDIPNLKITYGHITWINRIKLSLEKSHHNDAFIIAGGGTNQIRIKPIIIIQKHRNNRKLQTQRKGLKRGIRKEKYKIQPLDLFWINNKKFISKGMCHNGERVMINKNESFLLKKVEKIFHFGTFVFN